MTSIQNQLFDRAQKYLVGGVNSPVRAFKSVGGTPLFVKEGRGQYLISEDGRKYIDFCLSWGPLMFGHARREIIASAASALKKGTTFGAATEAEVNLAEKIQKALPSMELIRLTSSGTEAAMSALRVARAYTKRNLIVKFSGCYHGHTDSMLVAAGSGATTLGVPDSAGVPEAFAATTISAPYNDLNAVRDIFRQHAGQIAAVIVEPIAANMGVVMPAEGFLAGLRDITAAEKALLIFDEVITGFRVCFGGAQTIFNITPDLTVLGKIVGGGMPLAAYGGRREIMQMIAPLGPVYQAGTLSGNPVAVATGLKMLELLQKLKPYKKLQQYAELLAQGLQKEANSAGVPMHVQQYASMITPFFIQSPVHDYATAIKADKQAYGRFFHQMLERGVYLPPAQWEAAFTCAAHTERDIEFTLSAARQALKRVNL